MSIITDPGGTSDACSNVQSGQFATFKVPSESSPSGAEVLFLACAFMMTRSDTAMLQMLVSQHFTAINPCYPNQRPAETGSTQSFGSGGDWRSHSILLRFSYVTGWAPFPEREPRQSLTWQRIIRWCFKRRHSVLVALFVVKCLSFTVSLLFPSHYNHVA